MAKLQLTLSYTKWKERSDGSYEIDFERRSELVNVSAESFEKYKTGEDYSTLWDEVHAEMHHEKKDGWWINPLELRMSDEPIWERGITSIGIAIIDRGTKEVRGLCWRGDAKHFWEYVLPGIYACEKVVQIEYLG